jgi:putative flippase GtrA
MALTTDTAIARRTRASSALRHRGNWVQLTKFFVVGGSGYAINLAVYTFMLKKAGFHYLSAATFSFLAAVTNNYTWNRIWTFRGQRGHVAYQGLRFLVVALVAYAANLAILALLVSFGIAKVPAQACAIVLVTPLNFIGNKLWSFRARP